MAIVQGLLALATRSAGKVLNTVFGWATALLFGKVSEDRQIYLSVMTFGSVAWLVLAIGVAFPAVGAWLLAFAPLPDWVNHNWVRLVMLIGALVVPAIVGMVGLKMLEPEDRPADAKGKAVTILKGYPYTLGLAVTLVTMLVFAPFLKLPLLARRFESQHVPMIVDPQDYKAVVEMVMTKLNDAGWELKREEASWMLKAPTKVLTTLSGGAIEKMVANDLSVLRGKNAEVTVHPSDLVLSAPKKLLPRLRAVVAMELAFSPAHLTWTKEANELEDKIEALMNELRSETAPDRYQVRARLTRIEQELKDLEISFEEWEVLSRQKLLAESYLLCKSEEQHERLPERIPVKTVPVMVPKRVAPPVQAKLPTYKGAAMVRAFRSAIEGFAAFSDWREERAAQRERKKAEKQAAAIQSRARA